MSSSASTSISLEKDQLLVWQSPRNSTLEVLRGRVWVTASNQLDDLFVDAGQRLTLPWRSRVVISGECEAEISIRVSPLQLHGLVRRALTGLLRAGGIPAGMTTPSVH